MKRLALFLLIAGCDSPEPAEKAPAPAAPRPQGRLPTAAEAADSEAAAAVLRLYYERIGRGDYRGAWALRESRPGLAFEAFAESFAPYADYRATVHLPTLPVESDGFVWLEIPVQLYGRRRDGTPFGSVGQVTMRRPASGGDWRLAL
jgi:hypothetical protein